MLIFAFFNKINKPIKIIIMKKITLLMMKITLTLFLMFGSSNLLKAQEDVNIIDLQTLIPELSPDVFPTDMIEFQGELYIGMANGMGSDISDLDTELIKFDGVNAEIVDLGDYEVGSFAYFAIYNDELYFRLLNGQLGKYDSTTIIEINLTDLDPDHVQDPAMPGHMCTYNGELYFKIAGIEDGGGNGGKDAEVGEPLAKYDGTYVTVLYMGSLNDDLVWSCSPNSLVVYNNLLYFSSSDMGPKSSGYSLTSFDGNTTAEIIPFEDSNTLGGIKAYLCVYGDNLYMRADASEEVRESFFTLGKYDGTNPVSIIDLNDINPQIAVSNYPGHMAVHNNRMYFKTDDTQQPVRSGEANKVLASYDGNGNAVIHDLSLLDPSIAYDLRPSAITSYQGVLYFRGETSDRDGPQLIQYNGTQRIPISNWGLLLGILLISTLIVIRLFKR